LNYRVCFLECETEFDEDALLPAQPGTQISDKKFIQQLLRRAAAASSIGQRMKVISGRLLGAPYLVNPLIGSATEPERIVTTLSGFDCVTFMESVLALALAESADEFPELLREIRYVYGEVAWRRRHHYAVDWARHNVRRGFLQDITRGEETIVRRKTLDLLPGLPPRIVSFSFFPKKKLGFISPLLEDGDLIFFVSTRRGLDVFHTGLIVHKGKRVMLRHAARSQGAVVEQELKEFVEANRMSGFIVVRPRERARSESPRRSFESAPRDEINRDHRE
jgi:hypothetical protein